jgi:hypothetical protein
VCPCGSQVNAEAQKIAKEAEEANAIAAQVQVELDKALPALMEAEAALDVITKKDLAELKAYSKPPDKVDFTLQAVLTGESGPRCGGGRLGREGKGRRQVAAWQAGELCCRCALAQVVGAVRASAWRDG